MASVTRSTIIPADPETVENAIMEDVPAFIRAAGYDSVTVDEDHVRIENHLGLATLSLTLRRIDADDSTLAFEQEEGLFEEMSMQYGVDTVAEGTELTAMTEFTLGGVTGTVLDDTLVRRQRTSEIDDQFAYLERELEQ